MKRIIIAGILLIALVAVSGGVAAETKSINIVVAPHTLNLESPGDGVTVHTNIAYIDVNCSTVTLKIKGDEIPIRSCYSDLCGDLVVKVDRDDVVAVISDASPDCATFTLTGETIPDKNGDVVTFTGTDTIDVAANGSKK